MSFSLGFIGGGNMSTAIFNGIIKNGTHPASKIWVSGPHVEKLKHWEEKGANITCKNSDVFINCDLIFLGVKPYLLTDAIKGCLPIGEENRDKIRHLNICKVFVSMLAGVTLGKLYEELKPLSVYLESNDCACEMNVIRIMPNTPMAVGQGICLYTLGANISQLWVDRLQKVLDKSCLTQEVTESLMGTLGVLTACGPALIYMVIEALADGAVKQGVPRDLAQKFAAQMVVGSGHMVLETGKHPGVLKDEVCSPGGTTICAVSALENGNVRGTFINAIEAATLKTQGKKN